MCRIAIDTTTIMPNGDNIRDMILLLDDKDVDIECVFIVVVDMFANWTVDDVILVFVIVCVYSVVETFSKN